MGVQWLSGRELDSRLKGRGFEPHRRHCDVSLSKSINPSLVLVQPRKTRPFITERLLMGRKESNQTNKQTKVFCCGERSDCHSTCNSDSQLSVDSYRGSEILSPGNATTLNKTTRAVTRKWHNPDQTLSLKPKPAISDITKLKISLKSGYAHLSFN